MKQAANDRDAFRFRLQRRAGLRSLDRAISSRAAPRSTASGDQVSQDSRGGGGGSVFGNLTGPIGVHIGIPEIGDPGTGQRTAVWNMFAWDSALDVFGA